MPTIEKNDKTTRYREHRQQLTRFATSGAVAQRYAFLSELVMLWLDSKPDSADRAWKLLVFYINAATAPKRYVRPDGTPDKEIVDSPINDKAKEAVRDLLDDFLKDETEGEDEG